jgi:hypothetical protein
VSAKDAFPVNKLYVCREARATHAKSKHAAVWHLQRSPRGSAEAAAGMEAASAVEARSVSGSVCTATIGPPAASPTGVGPELALLGAPSCAGPMKPHWIKSRTVSAPFMLWQKAVKPICACGLSENIRAASTSNISDLSVLPPLEAAGAPRPPPNRKTMTSARRARGAKLEPTTATEHILHFSRGPNHQITEAAELRETQARACSPIPRPCRFADSPFRAPSLLSPYVSIRTWRVELANRFERT